MMRKHVCEALERAGTAGEDVPLIVAGDVFHTWNEPVELVSQVAEWLGWLPHVPVYFVAGQHDLPYHDLKQSNRSALYNLVLAAQGTRSGVPSSANVSMVARRDYLSLAGNWCAYFAAWGEDWWLNTESHKVMGEKALLVTHKYVHVGGDSCHPGASESDDVKGSAVLQKAMANFTFAVFGDNHHPFSHGNVYNHGCLIRRTKAERAITPELGVLLSNGKLCREPLAAAESDEWQDGVDDEPDPPAAEIDTAGFASAVKSLAADASIDFRSACNTLLGTADLSVRAKREILDLLEKETK